MERKIFTQIEPGYGGSLNDYLTHSGFRRSQNVLYRPACETCRECRSLRVRVGGFKPSKTQRRTSARNADLVMTICDPIATDEQFSLLQSYLLARHAGGGMSDMDFMRYQMMVEDSASETTIAEYRDARGVLIACVLIDGLSDGLSMVYSFFKPDLKQRSLGKYMIINHINLCHEMGLPYLYLGYWVENSPKMDYKSRFRPAEVLGINGWAQLEDIS